MTTPTVSVVTGVYNAERWIQGALDSILGQIFDDFEYIIVNDGSTDNTQEILDRYQKSDRRLRVVHQVNLGAAQALNKGIRLSRGKYIAILDADDFALSRRLEREVEFLELHPKHGLIGGHEIAVDVESGQVWLVRFPEKDIELRRSWVWRQKFAHSAIMMRRDAVERTGLYKENMTVGFDPDLWARIAAQYLVANISEPVVVRRHHSSSLSRSTRIARLLIQLQLNAKAVRRLSLSPIHYLALGVPLMYFFLQHRFVRRMRRGFRQEEILTVEEVVCMYQLDEKDISILSMALHTS